MNYTVFMWQDGDIKYIGATKIEDMRLRWNAFSSSMRKQDTGLCKSETGLWCMDMYARGVKPELTVFYKGPSKETALRVLEEQRAIHQEGLINKALRIGRL